MESYQERDAVIEEHQEEPSSFQDRMERAGDRLHDVTDRVNDASDRIHEKSNTAIRVFKHQRPPDGKSDYTDIPHEKRTRTQKIAAATWGIIAPATPITGVGHVNTIRAGVSVLRGDYVRAVKLAFFGRMPDTVDGLTADLTKTKSPFGAAWDAGGDNATMTFLFGTLMYTGKVDPYMGFTLMKQRAQTVYENSRIRALGESTNPTGEAKKAMTLASLYSGGILLTESQRQKGHPVRALSVKAASVIVGEMAIRSGEAAVNEYHTRRVRLEAVASQATQ